MRVQGNLGRDDHGHDGLGTPMVGLFSHLGTVGAAFGAFLF